MIMALKTLIQFPIFAPPSPTHHRSATEVRFSRWNNANAEKFNSQRRTQKEIEDEIRFHRRFDSADKIVSTYENADTTGTAFDSFKSTGTPSAPSRPSIPGKKSKYSKSPNSRNDLHPAFRPIVRPRKLPSETEEAKAGIKIDNEGLAYVFPDAPFEFQYSYTETPKVKPLKLREPPIAPFEPSTMPRPWTGRKPLPPSKKKIDFDSFRLPPPHKKGVKPVQAPGPFLQGSGPKYVKSREEILGEPLTDEEIVQLIQGCAKSKRQLNMGRDGLIHNMLENIHAHWKRRRVCKIKCKGVCTVDMVNVCQQLEEKTGGKIIYHRGGVIYLFRGRNYNYKTRSRFPLMLWKPITPVYPRLVKQAPDGLTLEEASEMRKKGRNLRPICKLGKNGVYCNLAKDVREAFEACELVRINCQGMNASDYRRIGAKLKDLVPCVLISFEHEHILMWRGRDWMSSLPEALEPETGGSSSIVSSPVIQAVSESVVPKTPFMEACSNDHATSIVPVDIAVAGSMETEDLSMEPHEDIFPEVNDMLPSLASVASPLVMNINNESKCPPLDNVNNGRDDSETLSKCHQSKVISDSQGFDLNRTTTAMSLGFEANLESVATVENYPEPSSMVVLADKLEGQSENSSSPSELVDLSPPWTQGVVQLRKQAVESGSAVVLDNSSIDADVVFERAVALAKSAPSGPIFRHQIKKTAVVKKCEKQEDEGFETRDIIIPKEGARTKKMKPYRNQRPIGLEGNYLNVAPQGTLEVDELAKLLA